MSQLNLVAIELSSSALSLEIFYTSEFLGSPISGLGLLMCEWLACFRERLPRSAKDDGYSNKQARPIMVDDGYNNKPMGHMSLGSYLFV